MLAEEEGREKGRHNGITTDDSKVSKPRFTRLSAGHLFEQGLDLRYIQRLLGYSGAKITEIYTHVFKRGY